MSLTVQTRWDDAAIRRMARQLSSRDLNMAMSVGLNASAKSLRTRARSKVAKGMGLRAKDIDGQIKVAPMAKPSSLYADVVGTGRPLPLIRFGATQKGEGVSAKAWGKRKTYKGTFIATMKSGHVGVFKRTRKSRGPDPSGYIEETWGPGVATEMVRDTVLPLIESEGSDILQKNIQRQLQRYIYRAIR